jgi:hypothetical protein
MMTRLQLQTVTVYEARRDGRPIGFALDRKSLIDHHRIRPSSRRTTIHEHREEVGVIEGEFVDWNAGYPGDPRLKAHWQCPQCGQQHFDDSFSDASNQFLLIG